MTRVTRCAVAERLIIHGWWRPNGAKVANIVYTAYKLPRCAREKKRKKRGRRRNRERYERFPLPDVSSPRYGTYKLHVIKSLDGIKPSDVSPEVHDHAPLLAAEVLKNVLMRSKKELGHS